MYQKNGINYFELLLLCLNPVPGIFPALDHKGRQSMKEDYPRTRGSRAKMLLSTTCIPVPADAGAINSPPAEMATTIDLPLDDRDLERLTGDQRSTWQKRRLSGNGPPFTRRRGPPDISRPGFRAH
jgi:hypothetical protein